MDDEKDLTSSNFLDRQKIAEEGSKIYEKIRSVYEPKYKGKFLAIDINTRYTYLGNTRAEAIEQASKNHPHKIFHVVEISNRVPKHKRLKYILLKVFFQAFGIILFLLGIFSLFVRLYEGR